MFDGSHYVSRKKENIVGTVFPYQQCVAAFEMSYFETSMAIQFILLNNMKSTSK
jgi:hypothetical protein